MAHAGCRAAFLLPSSFAASALGFLPVRGEVLRTLAESAPRVLAVLDLLGRWDRCRAELAGFRWPAGRATASGPRGHLVGAQGVVADDSDVGWEVRMSTARQAGSWSARLWQQIEPTYEAILAHPFLVGLANGTLDAGAFAHYVAQDVHYLRDYACALAVVGAKAPTHADTAMFVRHAAGAVNVELALHATLLPTLGMDAAAMGAVPVAPTTCAYTSYLLATAYRGSFADGLAAVLPCYWIYARVGAALVERGSPDPRYQRWIDTYAGEEFAGVVAEVLDLVDRVGPALGRDERERARGHLLVTARYEWMFWDAAHRREGWPL